MKNRQVVTVTEGAKQPLPLQFRERDDGTVSYVADDGNQISASKRLLGVEDTCSLTPRLLGPVGDVLAAHKGKDDLSGVAALNDAAALIQGIGPGDALEGMLAAQMVTTHSTAMHCLQIASVPRQPESIVESNINRATKLMRVYTAQVEALNRHRSKGRQTMTVKHVHVHDGGQAIVGNVRGREGGVGEQP
jgi:hypothetical protein